MKISPLDIRKQEFKKVMRGYDPVEVETFMEMLANEFESLLKEQNDMRGKLIEFETQLKDYKQIEKTLQQTFLQAQETTGKTYEAARRDAELIIKEAEMKASQIVGHANGEIGKLTNEIMQLRARKDSLLGRLRVLLSSELDLIKALEPGNDPILSNNSSHGTGNADIELDKILKAIDNDAVTPSN